MGKNIIKQILLLVPILGLIGCPQDGPLNHADARLTAVNNSSIKILFVAKDRSDRMLSWAGVYPHSSSSLPLVDDKWDKRLPKSADTIRIYCMDYSTWDGSQEWSQVNQQTSLKYSPFSRAQLDSVHWIVCYP